MNDDLWGTDKRLRLAASTDRPDKTPPAPAPSHADHQHQPAGHFIPADLDQGVRLRVLKAEVFWRSGLLTVIQIGERLGIRSETVYEWARLYHWPGRADVVEQSQQALRAEMLRRARVNWKKAQSLADPSSGTDGPATAEAGATAGRVEGVHQVAPSSPIDLDVVRSGAPLPSAASARAGIREAAAADAMSDIVLQEFVDTLSGVADAHQRTVQELQDWGEELMADARSAHKLAVAELKRVAQKRPAQALARYLPVAITNYTKIVGAMNICIGMSRKVFMLETPRSGWREEQENSGGIAMAPTPVVPTSAGSYEDYIAQAEREGKDLTPV
jgi:hypothetical protein